MQIKGYHQKVFPLLILLIAFLTSCGLTNKTQTRQSSITYLEPKRERSFDYWVQEVLSQAKEYNEKFNIQVDHPKDFPKILPEEDFYKNWRSYMKRKVQDPFAQSENWQGKTKSFPQNYMHLIRDLEKTFPELQYVEKTYVDPKGEMVLFGDIHGSIHSLLRNLSRLRAEGMLGSNWKLKNPDSKIVFLGDLVDRGRYSAEVLYTVIKLKNENWDQVFLVRGNHETASMTYWYGYKSEILGDQFAAGKYPLDHSHNIYELSLNFFSTLPDAIFLGLEHDTSPYFVQLSHGGIHKEFDLNTFLDLKNKHAFAIVPKSSGFMWSDFINIFPDEAKEEDKEAGFMKSERGADHAISAQNKYVRNYLADSPRLKAFFRGHQDMSFGVKMMFADETQIDVTQMNVGEYPRGPYHWKYVVDPQLHNSPKGLKLEQYFPVWTFSSATEGQSVPFDGFGKITLAKEFSDWTIDLYEFELPLERNGKFLKIDMDFAKKTINLTWSEKSQN